MKTKLTTTREESLDAITMTAAEEVHSNWQFALQKSREEASNNITDKEIVFKESCQTDVGKLLNLILRLERDSHTRDEEPMWYIFLASIKIKLISKPVVIILMLKTWLYHNQRVDDDDDDINDFLVELFSSIISSYCNKKRKRESLSN